MTAERLIIRATGHGNEVREILSCCQLCHHGKGSMLSATEPQENVSREVVGCEGGAEAVNSRDQLTCVTLINASLDTPHGGVKGRLGGWARRGRGWASPLTVSMRRLGGAARGDGRGGLPCGMAS